MLMRHAVRSMSAAGVLVVVAGAAIAQTTRLVPGQFPTIQSAINASVSGDTVLVSPGTYNGQINFSGKDVAVRSSGGATVTTINGGGEGSVVSFIGGETRAARLEGFTVTGGAVVGTGGGGVRIVGSSPTIIDCVILANTATPAGSGFEGRGGGVMVDGASGPLFTRVRFDSNVGNDAAGQSKGGGMWVGFTGAVATLESCVFVNNRVINANGGAIYVDGGGRVVATDTRFEGNWVTSGSGGGVQVVGGRLEVTGCTFFDNYAEFGSGGGIEAAQGATVVVTSSTFEGNDTREGGGPGAIALVGSTLTVTDSTFRANVAEGGSGAGIGAESSNVTVTGGQFIENLAVGGRGGGVNFEGGTLSITGATFTGNTGSAVGIVGGVAVVRDSDFSGNVGSGAGVYSANAQLTVERCDFTANRADGASGGGVQVASGQAEVRDSTFTDNLATGGSGAGVKLVSGTLLLERSVLRGGVASGGAGGGFDASGGTVTVRGVTFEGNQGGGAAVNISGSTVLTLESSRLLRNGLDVGGGFSSAGALRAQNAARATVVNCLIVGNSGLGGAVQVNRSATVTVVNSTLVDNVPEPGHTTGLATNNTATSAPAVLNVVNSIVRGDLSGGRRMLAASGVAATLNVSYSNVAGGQAGVGNINVAPIFVNAAAGDYRLGAGSAGIDAGNNGAVPSGVVTDLGGAARFFNDPSTPDTGVGGGAGGASVVDMGAHEFAPPTCRADLNNDGELTFDDIQLFVALFNASDARADFNNDGEWTFDDIQLFVQRFNAGC